jgi:hypothetical protein
MTKSGLKMLWKQRSKTLLMFEHLACANWLAHLSPCKKLVREADFLQPEYHGRRKMAHRAN